MCLHEWHDNTYSVKKNESIIYDKRGLQIKRLFFDDNYSSQNDSAIIVVNLSCI